MTKYINFFPGNMRDGRGIDISETADYGMASDLGDLLDSMLQGCSASLAVDGVKDALCDGVVLGAIKSDYKMDDVALQEVAEELHSAL